MKLKRQYHSEELRKRWKEFPFLEQMANIGSEVHRAIKYRKNGDEEDAILAFYRSLELIDFTKESNIGGGKLKELCRVRECWVSFFMYDNEYNFNEKFWLDYFYDFTYANAIRRGV